MQDKIIISGDNLELTDAIKSNINTKAEKLFNHSNDIIKIQVVVGQDQKEFFARFQIEIYGPVIVVESKTENLYKSIAEAADHADRQLRIKRRKKKAKNHTSDETI